MAQSTRTRPTHSVLPARPPLLIPHPPAAALIPPLHVVDLMTAEGSAAFAATWRVREAKLVECPALGDAMPALISAAPALCEKPSPQRAPTLR